MRGKFSVIYLILSLVFFSCNSAQESGDSLSQPMKSAQNSGQDSEQKTSSVKSMIWSSLKDPFRGEPTQFYGWKASSRKELEEQLKVSMEQGSLDAYYNQALIFLGALGDKIEFEKARPLLETAAGQGHPWASYQLGLLIEEVDGYEANKEEICKLHSSGSRAGIAPANYLYARCVEAEEKKALLLRALQGGIMEAGWNLAYLETESSKRLEILRKIAPLQRDAYYEIYSILKDMGSVKASEALSMARQQRDPRAWLETGLAYLREGEYEKALPDLYKASELGNGRAAYLIASLGSKGLNSKEVESACDVMKRSARLGYHSAFYALGLFYQNPALCGVDQARAYAFYKLALEKGDSRAGEAMEFLDQVDSGLAAQGEEILASGIHELTKNPAHQQAQLEQESPEETQVVEQESSQEGSSQLLEEGNEEALLAEIQKQIQSGNLETSLLVQGLPKLLNTGMNEADSLQILKATSSIEDKSLEKIIDSHYQKLVDSGKSELALKLALEEIGSKHKEWALQAGSELCIAQRAAFNNTAAIATAKKMREALGDRIEVLGQLAQSLDAHGLDLFNEKKEQEAQQILEQALTVTELMRTKYPDRFESYLLSAVSTGNLARFKSGKERVKTGGKIEEFCLKSIELNPKQGRSYAIVATYYWEVSKLSWILKAFARSFLGKLPEKSRSEALELYVTSITNDPDQIYAQFKIAQLYQAMNKKDKAKVHLEICLKLKPISSGDKRVQEDARALLSKL